MGKCLLFVLAVLAPGLVAAAEGVCYQYRIDATYYTTSWHNSETAAVEEFFDACESPTGSGGGDPPWETYLHCEVPAGFVKPGTMQMGLNSIEPWPGHASDMRAYYTRSWVHFEGSAASGSGNIRIRTQVNPEGCPPPPCEQWQDVSASMEGTGALPANVCRNMGDGSMCRFVPAGGVSLQLANAWAGVFKGDGSECSPSDNVGTAANCIMMASGKYACAGKPSNPNCGKLNGEDVCLEKMPEGSCAFMADGSVICDADAPNQPDNGTPGEQATPDAVMGLGSGEGAKEFNYYTNTTVAGSSGGGSGLSGVGPDAVSQDGGLGDGEGDGDGDGAGEICEGSDCYGEDGIGGQIAECSDDFEECITGFAGTLWETIEELPMMEFVASLHEAFGTTGACPEGSFTLWNETYDVMAPACGLITDHTGTFHLLFQVIWSLAGLRIILEG